VTKVVAPSDHSKKWTHVKFPNGCLVTIYDLS
jgi:hypothetical protein